MALALLVLLSSGTDAFAARPVGGALYVADRQAGFDGVRVELRVSKTGRRLSPTGSRVYIPSSFCGGARFRIGRPGRAVRVGADGRFAFGPRGKRGARLRGRFVTPNRVSIAIRYRPAGDPLPLSCGAPVRHDLSLERLRRHPFRDCRSHRERSALDAPTGRVFHDFYYGRRGWEDLAWGCLFSENRRVILARRRYDTADAGYDKFKLVGPYAAFLEFECFGLTCPEWWNVVDLRDGRELRELPQDLGANLERVTDLELRENGSVAVIAVLSRSDQFAPGQLQVWAFDAHGPRRLDEGNIDATSLELSGSTLTWIKDGVQVSAVLD